MQDDRSEPRSSSEGRGREHDYDRYAHAFDHVADHGVDQRTKKYQKKYKVTPEIIGAQGLAKKDLGKEEKCAGAQQTSEC